jgi:hypothetical protein
MATHETKERIPARDLCKTISTTGEGLTKQTLPDMDLADLASLALASQDLLEAKWDQMYQDFIDKFGIRSLGKDYSIEVNLADTTFMDFLEQAHQLCEQAFKHDSRRGNWRQAISEITLDQMRRRNSTEEPGGIIRAIIKVPDTGLRTFYEQAEMGVGFNDLSYEELFAATTAFFILTGNFPKGFLRSRDGVMTSNYGGLHNFIIAPNEVHETLCASQRLGPDGQGERSGELPNNLPDSSTTPVYYQNYHEDY